ncbi:hypothetical protein DEM27_10620 [Metarhizobium album]|uniref:Uncharacterized protein n=2 Tax=Metarhizobium album TaxID=2182425 RepID=A0A2U2DRG7_9HYPH|nr:hypothetical protein DEM27_10620 [Rhizobium album]
MTAVEEVKITHSGPGEYTPVYLTIKDSIVAVFAGDEREADPYKSVWMSHSQFEQIAAFCCALAKPQMTDIEWKAQGDQARVSGFAEGIERAAKIADEHAADFEKQAAAASSARMHDALLLASDACELTADAIRVLSATTEGSDG